jgi:class 3 adenylate cyclase
MSRQNKPASAAQRKLAAVLSADIDGYTTLRQSDEKRAPVSLQKFKRELETHAHPQE